MRNRSVLLAVVISLFISQFAYGQAWKKLKAAAPKKPIVTYDRFEVVSTSFDKTVIDFVYIVDNPNAIGLDHIFVDYELFVKEQSMALGKDIKFQIKAKSKSELRLQAEFNYTKVFKSAAILAKTVIGGEKSVPFTIKTNFKVDLKLIKFNIPLTAEGDIPLPKIKTKLF